VKRLFKYKFEILFVLLIICLYFLLRIPNLTLQPIFADEAIYIRWAQVMKAEPSLRFLPLSDGKTPLFMWVMIPLFKVFKDPLMAGRILSVFSGLLTLSGVFFIGLKFFNKRIAFLSILLVTVVPYSVFFDRMALVDSMLAAFTIWVLGVALLLIKFPRIDLAILLGYLLGGGILTKTPGLFNFVLLPITIFSSDWGKSFLKKDLPRIISLWLIAVVMGAVVYNILRLGPGFSNLGSRDADYRFGLIEVLRHPLDPFIPHLGDVVEWFPALLTWPLIVTILLGTIFLIRNRDKTGLVVFLWSLIPMVFLIAILKQFTARYLLFCIPPLYLIAAYGLDQFLILARKNIKYLAYLLIGLILVSCLYFDFWLLVDPLRAPLARKEREGYLGSWTAGYNLREIAQFLADEASKNGTVVVGTEGYFGTLPEGLQIYLNDNRQVIIVGGQISDIEKNLRKEKYDHPTFFVSNRPVDLQNYIKGLRLIKEYRKPIIGESTPFSIGVFEILPKEASNTASRP
jgi:4-amino-4-deoxy-L-arabinose transferase-like glycosyltransferase